MSPTSRKPAADLPVMLFSSADDWTAWLAEHHADSPGLWLRLAKKDAALRSLSYAEALDVALCFGWIDGQKRSYDADSWLQRFTRRGPRSIWSKINRGKVEVLIAAGRMQPAGLAAVEQARADGRWDAAYDGSATATVPPDLQAALDGRPRAAAHFAALSRTERFGFLARIQTARTDVVRARRIRQLVEQLERDEPS